MTLYIVRKYVPGSLFMRGQTVVFKRLTRWDAILSKIEQKSVEEWWIEY